MTRLRTSTTIRLLAGGAVLAALLWRVGAQPFIDGLRLVDARSLLIALVVGVVTTVCCAWRWQVISRGLGVRIGLGQATSSYYRSIFLNTTLPGGVVGDVHRAVRHGQDSGDVGRGVRSVAWERTSGQLVQVAATVLVLLLVPSPVRSWVPAALLGLIVIGVCVALLDRAGTAQGASRIARAVRVIRDDMRTALLPRHAWPIVMGASVIVVAGHATVFIVAAQTAGTAATAIELLPLALIVLAAAAIPLSIAGWGPREGVAAWAFAAAGLGAAAGITTAVVYGVMALVATLPGAAVLVAASLRQRSIPREEVVHG